MQHDRSVYRFGPFELDSFRRTLTRGGERVAVSVRAFDVLLVLVGHAGELVSKDLLFERAWPGLAVTDNSIVQAIKVLRELLGDRKNGDPYIETNVRRGYRFIAPVTQVTPRTAVELDHVLSPHRAFLDGRAALETFDRHGVARAREAFEEAVRATPNLAEPHIGIANSCVLAYEASGADAAPDVSVLACGERHAREACERDPSCAEAWSTLAFILYLQGNSRDGIAAARNAVTIEPNDWRHYLSLAFVEWGEQRLRAARKLQSLCPGLAVVDWLTATVFIARQAFDAASEVVRAGCAAQDSQLDGPGRFHIPGLHLLHGQLLAARGALGDALDELDRELAHHHDNHVYARECDANVWYSIGAIRWRQGQRDRAEAAFSEALRRAPAHRLSRVAMAALSGEPPIADEISLTGSVDVAIGCAARLTLAAKHDEAARVVGDAIRSAQPGPDGWTLPIDPLIHPTVRPAVWTKTFALLRERAA